MTENVRRMGTFFVELTLSDPRNNDYISAHVIYCSQLSIIYLFANFDSEPGI